MPADKSLAPGIPLLILITLGLCRKREIFEVAQHYLHKSVFFLSFWLFTFLGLDPLQNETNFINFSWGGQETNKFSPNLTCKTAVL